MPLLPHRRLLLPPPPQHQQQHHPVALAFAVAALQSGTEEPPLEARELVEKAMSSVSEFEEEPRDNNDDESSTTTTTTTTTGAGAQAVNGGTTSQTAGSGSDSRLDKPSMLLSSDDLHNNSNTEEDAEKRLARSRERNREHARRTRLRKKAQLEALQGKVKGLEAERQVLKQQIEECSIASILLGLSSGEQDQDKDAQERSATSTLASAVGEGIKDAQSTKVAFLTGSKRKRFLCDKTTEKTPPVSMQLTIDGQTTVVCGGGKSHINWKTGFYCNEDGVQKQLTHDQLENLRRERNRMHAKMTRDRKKNFIGTIEKTIEELEHDIRRLQIVLAKVSSSSSSAAAAALSQMVTPMTSPEMSPIDSPCLLDANDDDSSVYSKAGSTYSKGEPSSSKKLSSNDHDKSVKHARHGFSLND